MGGVNVQRSLHPQYHDWGETLEQGTEPPTAPRAPHPLLQVCVCVCVCVCIYMCVCVCVCVRVYVVYEDTNLYNDMGMTEVLQFEGVLWGTAYVPVIQKA